MSDKITLEQLQELLSEQSEQIKTLHTDIAELKLKLAVAAGKDIKAQADKKPEIPNELVQYNDKEYKWKVAAFRLPGVNERYTAEEAATDEKIIAKILAIKGQKILQEQA